ncbi:hypothetical protein M4L38_00900 [Staphylococcus equorum]|uniref:hypothetical protein n=1 Tax=Staphylococcus equorum TaxID=246432 RepID=UPI0024088E33|nr:hypothetical protein [Staphylococcus equorum]MDG0821323.1 hypothetical protein [Staphylococcus equorum]
MFKQIYDREDGRPKLIESDSEGNFNIDEFLYTENAPSSDLHEPMYFNGNEWISATKEEYEESLPEKEPHIPKVSEIILAQAQMQVTKTANQLIKTQQEQADTLTELTKKEQRLKEIEHQQAETLLEIAKLKGEK